MKKKTKRGIRRRIWRGMKKAICGVRCSAKRGMFVMILMMEYDDLHVIDIL